MIEICTVNAPMANANSYATLTMESNKRTSIPCSARSNTVEVAEEVSRVSEMLTSDQDRLARECYQK